jgi:hypothetical protein
MFLICSDTPEGYDILEHVPGNATVTLPPSFPASFAVFPLMSPSKYQWVSW